MAIRSWLRTLSCLAIAAAGVLMTSSPASAKDEVGMEAGVDSTVMLGGAIPVKVVVKTDRLVRGEVRVKLTLPDFGGTGGPVSVVPLEVPAGATKAVNLVIPNSFSSAAEFVGGGINAMGGIRLDASFVAENGDTIGTKRVAVRERAAEFVGLLPGVLDGAKVPKPTEFGPDLPDIQAELQGGMIAPDAAMQPGGQVPLSKQQAIFMAVEPGASSVAPWDAYGQLVATSEDLAGLSEAWRDSLTAWVAHGGRLVIDAPVGTAIDGFPAEWSQRRASVSYALGEIAYTDGRAARGSWDSVLTPRYMVNTSNGFVGGVGGAFGFGYETEVIRALAEVSGVSNFGIKVPAILITVYILLVGPVLFIVLGRSNRQPLAWALIPVVALIGTAATWGIGTIARSNVEASRVSVVEVSGDTQRVFNALGSPQSGGSSPVFEFPPGSSAMEFSEFDPFWGRTANSRIEATRSNLSISPDSERGDYSVAAGLVDIPATNRLSVSAQRENSTGDVIGKVTNDSQLDIKAAIVLSADGQAVNIGDVLKGQTKEFRLDASAGKLARNGDFGPLTPPDGLAIKSWAQFQQTNFGNQQVASSLRERPLGLWAMWRSMSETAWPTPGLLSVAGWTEGANPTETRVDGNEVRDGPTLFIQRTVVPELVPTESYPVSPAVGAFPAVRRYVVGDRAANTGLRLIAPASLGVKPRVWRGGQWVELTGELELPRRIPPDIDAAAGRGPKDSDLLGPDTSMMGPVFSGGAEVAPTTTAVAGNEPASTTSTTPPTTMAPAAKLFPDGASAGKQVTGPPATITRAQWSPIVDIPEPRSQSNVDDPLLYEKLSLWEIPEDAIAAGQVYIASTGGDYWQRPNQVIEVPNG